MSERLAKEMKFRSILIGLAVAVLAGPASGYAVNNFDDHDPEKNEETTAAQSNVTVSLCMLSGNVVVRGWDKNVVTARSEEGAQVQFQRPDGNTDNAAPASKIDVVVMDTDEGSGSKRGCRSSSDIELNVPHGATVLIQSRDGNIDIAEVATAYAGTQNGEVSIERVTRATEVGSIGGNICVSDTTGSLELTSIGGTVTVSNVRPVESGDVFQSTTVSGDIELDQVGHSQINLRTVNGNMKLTGRIPNDGRYGINTMSGDVTLALPADSSFRLDAKMASGGDIITDFPLTLVSQTVNTPVVVNVPNPKVVIAPIAQPANPAPQTAPKATPAPGTPPKASPTANPTPPTPAKAPIAGKQWKGDVVIAKAHSMRRVSAICGTGEALITVASFSGTLHLQKN